MRQQLSWIEYLATNQGVRGSNPFWRATQIKKPVQTEWLFNLHMFGLKCPYGISFLLCKNAHIWSNKNRSVKGRFFYALQSFLPTALMEVGFWLYIAVSRQFHQNAKTEKIAICCRLTIRGERFFVLCVIFGHKKMVTAWSQLTDFCCFSVESKEKNNRDTCLQHGNYAIRTKYFDIRN